MNPSPAAAAAGGFDVQGWIDRLGGFIERHRPLWIRLGDLETRLVAPACQSVQIDRPVYVAGLARSGSTILLETLARHPDVATHRYRDYPPVFTPYLWNKWLDHVPKRREQPTERTHKDGIKVTSESPEAFEEVLWMAFFPRLHDPMQSAMLDRATRHPAFERFYRDHIRKLLAVRDRARYVAKGNYNVTRMGYLLRLFPDARFVVPVRHPVRHIASLMRQHRLFTAGQHGCASAARHLRRIGHFEFGLDRRPINVGDPAAAAEVRGLWRSGEEVAGWARYWAMIHGYLADALAADADLRRAALVVRHEDLCREPRDTLDALFWHCGLSATESFLADASARMASRRYYDPGLSDADLAMIARETGAVARRFGYDVEVTSGVT